MSNSGEDQARDERSRTSDSYGDIAEMHYQGENYSLALEYCLKALECIDDSHPDRVPILLRASDCHAHRGEYAEAERCLDVAAAMAGERDGVALRRARVAYARGDYETALDVASELYDSVRDSDRHALVGDALTFLAKCRVRTGEPGVGADLLRDALSAYRRVDDRAGAMRCYINLGVLHKNACEWEPAVDALNHALALARELGIASMETAARINRGIVFGKRRRFDEALGDFDAALLRAQQMGDQPRVARALLMQGRTFGQLDEIERAASHIESARAVAERHGLARELALADEYLGELSMASGDYRSALERLETALAGARRIAPDGDIVAECLRRKADVEFALNRPDRALKTVGEGLALAATCGELYEIGYLLRTRGLCLLRAGERRGAIASLEASLATFEEHGNELEAARAAQLLGRTWLQAKDDRRALYRAKVMLGDAARAFRELREDCEAARSHCVASVAERRLGNVHGALAEIREAEALCPDDERNRLRHIARALRRTIGEEAETEERESAPAPRTNTRRARKSAESSDPLARVLTGNAAMRRLLELVKQVAPSSATVLLQGETGTGKGLIAEAIHALSARRDRPLVHVNCAALPEQLLESELFGHVRGSFTGAVADKDGLLSEARGGTVFLDEISRTSLATQGKLLQFLDTGRVRRVGSNELLPVDVRVVCASKSDLLKMSREGAFLEDLFYRINDFPLTVPPLRRRGGDVSLLARHYVDVAVREIGREVAGMSDAFIAKLRQYAWPGNVRELQKVIKRAVILADEGDVLDLPHLPVDVVSPAVRGADAAGSLKGRLEQLERSEILDALERHGWNKSQAALDLEVSYQNLLHKIKRYNLQ